MSGVHGGWGSRRLKDTKFVCMIKKTKPTGKDEIVEFVVDN